MLASDTSRQGREAVSFSRGRTQEAGRRTKERPGRCRSTLRIVAVEMQRSFQHLSGVLRSRFLTEGCAGNALVGAFGSRRDVDVPQRVQLPAHGKRSTSLLVSPSRKCPALQNMTFTG